MKNLEPTIPGVTWVFLLAILSMILCPIVYGMRLIGRLGERLSARKESKNANRT